MNTRDTMTDERRKGVESGYGDTEVRRYERYGGTREPETHQGGIREEIGEKMAEWFQPPGVLILNRREG